MPWNSNRYPAAMKNLPPRVRLKAIMIANALLDEGYEEGRCIRIAINRAKQWGQSHRLSSLAPKPTVDGRRRLRKTDD